MKPNSKVHWTIKTNLSSYRAVGSMIFTLFFPLIPFILQIIVCAYWGASALYLASMGSGTFAAANKTVTNETVNGEQEVKDNIQKYLEEVPCDPNVSYIFKSCSGIFRKY